MVERQAARVRIGVADDQPEVRKTFVRLLEALGNEVVFAVGDGAELVDRCCDEQVDMVFVDLDMPVMDGLAAAEQISAKGIPVVLVSGHPDAESVVLEHEPVVMRIIKPATPDMLRRAIAQALAQTREHANQSVPVIEPVRE